MGDTCPAPFVAICRCGIDESVVWVNVAHHFAIYPRSHIIAWRGMLFKYTYTTQHVFGRHKLMCVREMDLAIKTYGDNREPYLSWRMRGVDVSMRWSVSVAVTGVGVAPVRVLQRFWRGVRRRRWQERALALMMATHKRLGSAASLSIVDDCVLRMCCQ